MTDSFWMTLHIETNLLLCFIAKDRSALTSGQTRYRQRQNEG